MPTLQKKLNKYQAIRQAQDEVRPFYKSEDGWRFDRLNPKTQMWESCAPGSHAVVQSYRTTFLINRARKLLGKKEMIKTSSHWMDDV